MKIGVFADAHYAHKEIAARTRRPNLSLGKIKAAMDAFRKANVDYCICMGDLVDANEDSNEDMVCVQEALNCIRSYGIPFVLVPGNHDYQSFTGEEWTSLIGQLPPYAIDAQTHRFVFLDANYRSDFRRFDDAGVVWTDSNIPPEQIERLKELLATSDLPCVVFVHENLDDSVEARHVIHNAADVRACIRSAENVRLVVQGHYHKGAESVIDGIPYKTIPAMCEGTENRFFIIPMEEYL